MIKFILGIFIGSFLGILTVAVCTANSRIEELEKDSNFFEEKNNIKEETNDFI